MWPFRKQAIEPTEARIALGNFTLSAVLPNQRNIQVAGYVYSDDDEDALNKRLDLYQIIIERQRDRCEIPELEAARDQKVKALENLRAVLAELEERQRSGEKLTSQETMNIKNIRVNLAKVNEDIDQGTAEIADRKRKAGIG